MRRYKDRKRVGQVVERAEICKKKNVVTPNSIRNKVKIVMFLVYK